MHYLNKFSTFPIVIYNPFIVVILHLVEHFAMPQVFFLTFRLSQKARLCAGKKDDNDDNDADANAFVAGARFSLTATARGRESSTAPDMAIAILTNNDLKKNHSMTEEEE